MRVRKGADLDTAVAQVLDSLVETSGVCRAGLALAEGGGRRLRFTASDRDLAVAEDHTVALDWCHIDAYEDVPLTQVVRTGGPVFGNVESLGARFAEFAVEQRDQGVAAVAALPLVIGTSTLGGIVLFFDEQQPFGDDQLELMTALATQAAASVRLTGAVVSEELALPDVIEQDGVAVARTEVEPLPISVALARRFARRQLHVWKVDDDVLDTAVLCLSELVTNVVIHTASRSQIELRQESRRVVVTVRDSGTGAHARTPSPETDPLLVHGRGLRLVEALADEWGSESDDAGTTVWCSFAIAKTG
ncbi:hypothetical protein BH09ACT12_BH09ACT12_06900 [soil metagenome]